MQKADKLYMGTNKIVKCYYNNSSMDGVGNNIVYYKFPLTLRICLPAPSTNATVNLRTFINANNPNKLTDIEICNNYVQPTIVTGNLNGLNVTFTNNSEIQGSNEGATAFSASTPIKLINKGWIRGAGGRGGTGGSGGRGATGGRGGNGANSSVNSTEWRQASGLWSTNSWNQEFDDNFGLSLNWNGVKVYEAYRGDQPSVVTVNGSTYRKGTYRGSDSFWGINYNDIGKDITTYYTGGQGGNGGSGGQGGAGGEGGKGRYFYSNATSGGYGSAGTIGVNGAAGGPSNPAGGNSGGRGGKGGQGGSGGRGGQGGGWGQSGYSGNNGSIGGAGTFGAGGQGVSPSNGGRPGTPANGTSGGSGSAPGYSIIGTSKLKSGSVMGNLSGPARTN